MAMATVITLDTTAPTVEFGVPMQDRFGRLNVPYVVPDNDLESLSAQLLIGGGELDMAVLPDRFIVQLPDDHDDHLTALVRVVARDDVWNEEVYTLPLYLTGQHAELVVKLEKMPSMEVEAFKSADLMTRVRGDVRIEAKTGKASRLNVDVMNDDNLEAQ